ncbi:hypothetical protein HH682_13665 [Rosenbergiella sp. S61]|uniref:Uncharacterized protein n=1 Tax=Rosenbergiella gaditana TaxID=2726987 RepID=A0ABS5SZB9_9GAMM|nr:hypothetical protein [Rosenbergiella gaditana]MBT0725446.1 hypothetical protein [Rosenbergiella gaditana]
MAAIAIDPLSAVPIPVYSSDGVISQFRSARSVILHISLCIHPTPKLTLWLFALFSARLSHHSDGVIREHFVSQSMFRFDGFIITISGIIVNTARDNLSLRIVMLLIYQCIYFLQTKKKPHIAARYQEWMVRYVG